MLICPTCGQVTGDPHGRALVEAVIFARLCWEMVRQEAAQFEDHDAHVRLWEGLRIWIPRR